MATRAPGGSASNGAQAKAQSAGTALGLQGPGTVLSSDWTGLSPHLLATLYPVDFTGTALPYAVSVQAPASDGNVELSGNWQSPFEHSGVESKAPAITAMLQSGTLQSYAEALLGKASSNDQGVLGKLKRELSGSVTDLSQKAQGRTGMTKMNSTQIFTGSAPLKMPMTLHFRAVQHPTTEVQDPRDQLARWVLPISLAADGSIVAALKNYRSGQGLLASLLPSQAPQMVALRYGGYTFSPMVIESISHPITGPRSVKGEMLSVSVNIVLATLTSLDGGDWLNARQGKPTVLFNNAP